MKGELHISAREATACTYLPDDIALIFRLPVEDRNHLDESHDDGNMQCCKAERVISMIDSQRLRKYTKY
jgi:hypothetical protein